VKGSIPSHHHAHQVEGVHMQMYIGMCATRTENDFSYAAYAALGVDRDGSCSRAVASAQEVRLTR
jgi:hypothetical protein